MRVIYETYRVNSVSFKKLIIQIPCFNEQETLPQTLAALPKTLSGCEQIETLVINDGSTDNTEAIARELGVDHILSLKKNSGLAQAFAAGMQYAIEQGADIIVNTDGDNQYNANDIEKMIAPIMQGTAQIVIGTRPIEHIAGFSTMKKKLQRLGSYVVRCLSGTAIIDATSGFRAIHVDAAKRIKIQTQFSYSVEMIMHAGFKHIPITCVPVRVNIVTRPSRLMKNTAEYIAKQMLTMGILCWHYKPLRLCVPLSIVSMCLGLCIMLVCDGKVAEILTYGCIGAAIACLCVGVIRQYGIKRAGEK